MKAPAREVVGLLVGGGVANTGLRVAALAVPWFVLTSTGSAAQTGLVVAAEFAPYILAKTLSGPVVDRLGQRRVSITADLLSALALGAVPLLYALGALSFPVLLVLVAVGGAIRGPGDNAKDTTVPLVAESAGVPLERVTGLYGAVERGSGLVGPGLAAVLIGLVGAAGSIVVTAVAYALCALVWLFVLPRHLGRPSAPTDEPGERSGYLAQLREGAAYLVRDRLIMTLVLMIAVTNLIDIAKTSVFLPVWAVEQGHGVQVVGLLLTCFAVTALTSSLIASGIGSRLPRRATYFVAFALAGPPPYIALALDLPVPAVAAVYLVAGFGSGFLNPMLGAIFFERIPKAMLGRVLGLSDGIAWAGVPFGGLAAAGLIALAGLTPALFVAAGVYALATLLPAVASRESFDPPETAADDPEAAPRLGQSAR